MKQCVYTCIDCVGGCWYVLHALYLMKRVLWSNFVHSRILFNLCSIYSDILTPSLPPSLYKASVMCKLGSPLVLRLLLSVGLKCMVGIGHTSCMGLASTRHPALLSHPAPSRNSPLIHTPSCKGTSTHYLWENFS